MKLLIKVTSRFPRIYSRSEKGKSKNGESERICSEVGCDEAFGNPSLIFTQDTML